MAKQPAAPEPFQLVRRQEFAPGRALFQLENRIDDLIAGCVDAETGEISETAAADLDRLAAQEPKVLLDMAAWVKSERAWAASLASQASVLLGRARAAEARCEKIEEHMRPHLPMGEELRDGRARIYWRTSKAVMVEDEAELPEYAWRVKREVNKSEIAARLRKGEAVPGALFVGREHLVIE